MKKTSNDGLVLEHSSRPPWAVLADFDVDGATLKKHHKDWLDETLIASAKAKPHGMWIVDLQGRASRTGSNAHNYGLSIERLESVQSYINSRVAPTVVHFHPQPLGESAPNDPAVYENDLDRSVDVKAKFFSARPPKKNRLLIPKFTPWKPRANREVMDFTLQVLKAKIDIFTLDLRVPFGKFGHGHSVVKMLIEIQEFGTSDMTRYEFDGGGPGNLASASFSIKGARPGPGVSSWSRRFKNGKKHRFATKTWMDAEDFATPSIFRMDELGTVFFAFGPKNRILGPSIKIRDLGLGKGTAVHPLTLASCMATAKMEVVSATPSWAK